ncbi:MAG: AraC family transcriptional regulator [Clostridia bacterium]|nr:AraC family transcriptional regulator [Clostridia bacterium]
MKIEYALRANNYCKEIVNYLKKMHRHAYFEICTVVSGKAKHVVGEEEFILSTGDILFMPSETFHNILPETDDYYHLDIYMNNSFAEEVCGFYSKEMYSYYVKTKAPVVIKVPDGVRDYILERARYMISLFDTRQNSRAESIYRMLCSFITGMVYDKSVREKDDVPFWYTKIIKNIYKPDIISSNVTVLAETTGFSYSHLSKLFKKYTGETLANFFLKAKVNYGTRLLTDTNLSISKIAKMAGYDSLSHFTKIFKKYNGITPAKYRGEFKNR